ncbi:hypothetical protein GMORB2_5443 [Geosmithia morbida]|uniref:Uncharacterized protein n=1 Tax=Geosmithia morbida TaxID=1094350 RepID=A0A9P4YZR5_9HYPO|nr:uncharacterized protein GMORB2_5443 [Geosmithia morbida]KAF4124777.1 hypothetical protein GMORB2_5443 [Geosmithia morbida]
MLLPLVVKATGEWAMLLHPRQTDGQNLQSFDGAMGGVSADAITFSGDTERPYQVNGDTFPDYSTAANRACDNQKNGCADMANDAQADVDFEVSDCDQQRERCMSVSSSAADTAFREKVSSDADFDYFCEL